MALGSANEVRSTQTPACAGQPLLAPESRADASHGAGRRAATCLLAALRIGESELGLQCQQRGCLTMDSSCK
eukprot:2792334-Pleurochrysis_carterae.AAC.9